MVPPQRYFPWKVARTFFISSLALIGTLLFIVGLSVHLRIREIAGPSPSDVAAFNSYLGVLLLTVFLSGAAASAFLTSRFAQPLARLIQRARELRRLDHDEEATESGLEDPGEWSDLERALNRIHKDLRAKTEALSREREELSALIGAVSDAILAIDRMENPLFYNSQFAFAFRATSNAHKALRLSEIFRTPEVLDAYRQVLQTGERRIVTVSLHTNSYALPRHFSISIAPLKSQPGQPVEGAIGIFHDVTELKQSEQIRIEFVGNASHELRTPLTSIKGYVDTLRDDLKAQRLEDAPRFIEIISRNVDRLIFLVNDLLDLSTLESGAELEKSSVSTRELTESALKQVENKRAAKRQEIHASYKASTVLADPQRLEQILVNLIHNAIKYTPEGSVIEVIWENSNGGVSLRVKDNGPGIPLEHQGRLFERFYRVDAGRSRDQGGTGLGLAIVKHIMLKHGGSARVTSVPGEGAEFICAFP